MNTPPRLLLGRAFESAPRNAPGARTVPLVAPVGADPITLGGEAHVLTVAPPGAHKLSSVVIPNLLTFDGQVVVVDPAGEVYRRTARARREMGHTVLRLDPFHVVGDDTDALCPLDLTELDGSHPESDAQLIADLVYSRTSLNDVWGNSAFGLLSGIVGYVLAVPEKRTFTGLVSTFSSDDVVYNLAVVLDTIGKRLSPLAFGEIASFLPKGDDERGRILSTVTARTKILASSEVLKSLDQSTVPLPEIVAGRPVSVYLMIPPAKLRTHSSLLRLWLGTLLHCVTNRRGDPPCRTLFVLDECAQLGTFPALETALTLCRGGGLQVWTLWQDISEVRGLYPAGWPVLVRNCGAVQVFGSKDPTAAAEMAALLGIEPDDVLSLRADEVLARRDGECLRLRALDYASDPLCTGLFD